MSKYINDPREMAITPESGVTYEEDNRIEKMYHWGAKILDLCNMDVSEYMKPMTIIVSGQTPSPTPDPHEYVDLGLSVKWATCNIGAETPEEAGLYFAWGETSGYTAEQVGNEEGKRPFTWEDYQYGSGSSIVTDELVSAVTYSEYSQLKPEYDAATANWGEEWRMPTKEEIEELMELPHTWDSSRSGYSFTDGNNNELLFVFAGGCASDGNVNDLGEGGNYWSGSLGGDDGIYAWELTFNSDGYKIGDGSRYVGHTVRPVRSQNL